MLTNINLQVPVKESMNANYSNCPAKIQGCPYESPECNKGYSYSCPIGFIENPRCERCGSGREKIDKGVCKGIYTSPSGKQSICFLRW